MTRSGTGAATMGLALGMALLLAGCPKEGNVPTGVHGAGGRSVPAAHTRPVPPRPPTPQPAPADYQPLPPGTPAPAFTLTRPDGKALSLADFKGRIVVLEFVNWDCPFTRRYHANEYVNTVSSFYARDGVAWLAVESQPAACPEREKQMAQRYSAAFPVLADPDSKLATAYRVPVTPFVTVLDKEHRIAYQGPLDGDVAGLHKGPRHHNPDAYLETALEMLVLGRPVPKPHVAPTGTPLPRTCPDKPASPATSGGANAS